MAWNDVSSMPDDIWKQLKGRTVKELFVESDLNYTGLKAIEIVFTDGTRVKIEINQHFDEVGLSFLHQVPDSPIEDKRIRYVEGGVNDVNQ